MCHFNSLSGFLIFFHTKTIIVYVAFSNLSTLECVFEFTVCVYGECFHRLRVDGRPKRITKFAFTIVCVYNRLRVDVALVITAETCLNSKQNKSVSEKIAFMLHSFVMWPINLKRISLKRAW